MARLSKAALAAMAIVWTISGAKASSCDRAATAVQVDVREANLVVKSDLSLAELKAMAAALGRTPAHPVLGLYLGTVGYALRRIDPVGDPPRDGDREPCSEFLVRAQLVAVDRRIVVASDLLVVPCRFQAAAEHYRRHAAAASRALHTFAADLPQTLGPEIDDYLRGESGWSQTRRFAFAQHVNSLLDRAVEMFTRSLPEIQSRVDSSGEVSWFLSRCS